MGVDARPSILGCGSHHDLEGIPVRVDNDTGVAAVDTAGFLGRSQGGCASALQLFRWNTIPRLVPALGVTLAPVILWIFRDFSIIGVLTDGGPVKSTQTLSIMAYDHAFGLFKFGYASAVGVATLTICVIASRAMLGRNVRAIC